MAQNDCVKPATAKKTNGTVVNFADGCNSDGSQNVKQVKRVGGDSLQLTGISSGSFQVNGTRYKLYCNMRAANDMMTLIGYSSPVTFANASAMVMDMNSYSDEVPEGTTVYFTLISPATLEPTNAALMDFIYVSFYD